MKSKDDSLSNDIFKCKPLNLTYADEIAKVYMKNKNAYFKECDALDDLKFIEINDILCNILDKKQKICELFNSSVDVVYEIKINVNYLYEKFNVNKNHTEILCNIEYFDKDYTRNRPDHSIKIIKNYTVSNYKLYVNEHGNFHAMCYGDNKRLIYGDYFIILPLNMTKLIDEKMAMYNITTRDIKQNSNNNKMNLFSILIDSMSYAHFRRVMPITYDYLNNKLENNIIYTQLNSVGENTFPNMIPFLTGLVVEDIESAKVKSEINDYIKKPYKHFDDIPHIWNDYENEGFLTGFNADFTKIGIFNYLKKGFKYRPTAFYSNSFWNHKFNQNAYYRRHCNEGKTIIKTMINILETFLQRMNSDINKNNPYFLINFLGSYTHDFFLLPPYLDQIFAETLIKFEKSGYFDNTLVIIQSDHGQRLNRYSRTDMGKKERKLPFFSMRLPKKLWNSKYYINAENNKNKLISFFDLYQTLRHFLNINRNENKQNDSDFSINNPKIAKERGISLFENIPHDRSCDDALIPDNYCSCYELIEIDENYFMNETLFKYDYVVDFIVEFVNNITNDIRNKCIPYKKHKIIRVNKYLIQSKYRYQFNVKFQPGDTIFEAIIDIDKNNNNKLSIFGQVIRVSYYKKHSFCINDAVFKRYCYCSDYHV